MPELILSVLMVFLEVMPNEHLSCESSPKSSFPYNAGLAHLCIENFYSVKNEIIENA